VRFGGDTVTADGAQWLTLATRARPAGIEYDETEPWRLGLRFNGRIARGELYDGVDGELVAAPDASDWTTGTTFIDSEGVEWSTTAGTVGLSLERRVAALEALLA